MTTVHVIITGRVQGVGFRAWLEQISTMFGVGGWVRNRHDGWVEAVLDGDENGLGALIAMLRNGPPGARVEDFAVRPAEPEELALRGADEGFVVLPDA